MNSPATFQAMMNELFQDLILTGTVFVYMDDIPDCHSHLWKKHRHVVRQVLHILQTNQLVPQAGEMRV